MAYNSLSRSLHMSVSILLSEGWTDISDDMIQSAVISQIACSTSKLTMGEFCRNKIELSYIADSSNPINWTDRKIKVEMAEDESTEKTLLGVFYMNGGMTTKNGGTTYTITGYDTPDTMNDLFASDVSSTAVTDIVQSILTYTNMEFAQEYAFTLQSIDNIPTGSTNASVLAYIAGVDGKNIRVNAEGKLELYWYDTTIKDFTISRDQQWQGELTDNQSVSEISAIISGAGDGASISVGSGNALQFINPYVTKENLETILTRIRGFSYNAGSVKWRGDPAVRAGDTVKIETQEGVYKNFLVMENTITYTGGMYFKSNSYTYVQSVTVLGSKSPTERKLNIVYNKLNAALMSATDLMKGGSGGFYKLLTDEAGKPYGFQIADSDPISSGTKGWIFTNHGLFYSADGFQTVTNVAITMDGHIVGNFIDTGIISDGEGTSGSNWWNLDTGEIHIGNSNVVTKDDGVISAVTTYWLQTTSSETPEINDKAWSDKPVVFKHGNHVWQMTKTEYINPTKTPTYSNPVEITSPDIVSIIPYYRLSASETVLHDWLYPENSTYPGDDVYPSDQWSAEWHTEYPEWNTDMFLWIRQLITYTDGSTAWMKPVVDARFTDISSTITTYTTSLEQTNERLDSKAEASTVNQFYNDVLGRISQETVDRTSEIEQTASNITQQVTNVSNAAMRRLEIYYKTSISQEDVDAKAYLYPGDDTYPGEDTFPVMPIESDLVWSTKQPEPVLGHYLWYKYHKVYFDEATQQEVAKDEIKFGKLESSAYNLAIDNSAKLLITADSIRSEVSRKIDEDKVISAINQTAETVQISANKVQLESYSTKDEVKSIINTSLKGITLSVSGELGNTASIVMSAGGEEKSATLNLSEVRKSFADDKSNVTITAGAVTFNTGTFVLNGDNVAIQNDGTLVFANKKGYLQSSDHGILFEGSGALDAKMKDYINFCTVEEDNNPTASLYIGAQDSSEGTVYADYEFYAYHYNQVQGGLDFEVKDGSNTLTVTAYNSTESSEEGYRSPTASLILESRSDLNRVSIYGRSNSTDKYDLAALAVEVNRSGNRSYIGSELYARSANTMIAQSSLWTDDTDASLVHFNHGICAGTGQGILTGIYGNSHGEFDICINGMVAAQANKNGLLELYNGWMYGLPVLGGEQYAIAVSGGTLVIQKDGQTILTI